MRQCIPVDAELQASQVAIALRRCHTAKRRPGQYPRLARPDATVISRTSARGIRIRPACAGLPVRPSQSCSESDKDGHNGNHHEQRVGRHNAPPKLCFGHYPRRPTDVIDRDQKSESVVERPSGRGQRFDPGEVEQADAAVDDLDRAAALQLGEGAADCFDGQAEIICDVLPTHRK
jgi:hypothetical protein